MNDDGFFGGVFWASVLLYVLGATALFHGDGWTDPGWVCIVCATAAMAVLLGL